MRGSDGSIARKLGIHSQRERKPLKFFACVVRVKGKGLPKSHEKNLLEASHSPW